MNRGEPIVAVFVLDEHTPGIRPLGAASRWWLHHSLAALTRDLNHLGISLVLRKGAAGEVIRELVTETDADAVYWNRRYALPERDIDARLKSDLRDAGLAVRSFDANLLFEPWTVRTGSGTPYGVFTPFWKACLALPEPREPLPAPTASARRPARYRQRRPSGLAAAPHRPRLVRGLFERPGNPARPQPTPALKRSWPKICPTTRQSVTGPTAP